MSSRKRQAFLSTLLFELLAQYPQWSIYDHCKIECRSQPRNVWPEADIVIVLPTAQFIVEYDEDSNPGWSLVKYWPIIAQNGRVPLTIVEIWKRGLRIGWSYAELAKWMGTRLMELYPTFVYKFMERTEERARIIAKEVANIIEASPFSPLECLKEGGHSSLQPTAPSRPKP